jgi:hypothetical protein
MKGSKAFKEIIATLGNEFWTIARMLSFWSINLPNQGMTFLISS